MGTEHRTFVPKAKSEIENSPLPQVHETTKSLGLSFKSRREAALWIGGALAAGASGILFGRELSKNEAKPEPVSQETK